MPGATLTTLSNILKEMYLPPVVEQLNNEVLLLQRLETREATDLFGKRANVPVHTGRSGGIGARAESAALPNPGNQVYAVATYDLKYLYGRIRVTGPSMAKTASDAGAFLRALSSEMDGIRADLRKDTARQVYGTGDAVIAAVSGVNTAGVVPITSREPIDKGQLYVGMVVDIGTVANPVLKASGATITAVTPGTPSITLDVTPTATAGTDKVFRSGSATAAGSNEINGLQQIASTASTPLGGIDPSVAGNDYWDNIRSNVAGALSLDAMIKGFSLSRRAGGSPSLLIGDFFMQRTFWNLHSATIRYNDPANIKGGFQSLDFMGLPLVADIEAPWGIMYVLDERFLKVFSNRDWHFLDEDGSVLKWRSGFDEWEAVLARYMQLGATRRNVQVVLYGITGDTTGV